MVLGTNVISILIRATDKFSATFAKAKAEMSGFNSFVQQNKGLLLGAGAAAIGFGAAVGIGMFKATKFAVDAQETFNKFNVVFEDVAESAEKVAKNLQKNFGLSQQSAKEMLGATGDLLTGLGFTGEAALDLSEKANQLAVDLASFTNVQGGAERAGRALTKAMLGEREMLKELGISVLETDVKTRLLEQGQDKLTGTALKQAKALIVLTLAMEQSPKAIGDYARTQNEAANQAKRLKEDIEDLQLAIGTALIPVFESVVEKLRMVVNWFNNLSETQQKWIVIGLAVGAAILIIGGLAAIFVVIITALAGAFTFLMASIFPILIVVLAITAAILIAIAIWKNWDTIVEEFREGWENLKEDLIKVKEIIEAIVDAIGNAISAIGRFFSKGRGGGIPSFQHGGLVQQTGLALVHKGERVISRSRLAGRETGGINIFINELIGLDAEDVSRSLREELFNKLSL